MFDLEQAIADWQQKMLAAGIETPVPLEELELHLREEMERQMKSGLDAPRAFEIAVQQMGEARPLETEFKKIPAPPVEQMFQIFCAMLVELAGCLFCLHGVWQLFDLDLGFAHIGGSFSFENLLFGPLANLIMGMGSMAFGGWLIWRAGRSLKSLKLIVKVVLGSAVIAFGIILSAFLVPNVAKIAHQSNPSRAILLLGAIVVAIFMGVLLIALVNCFKPFKGRPPVKPAK